MLLCGSLAALPPALAQPGPAGGAPLVEPPPPEPPAATPPAPARLDAAAAGAAVAQRAPAATAPLPGLETLPGGGWRLRWPTAAEAPPDAARPVLAELGRRLAARAAPGGRFTLAAQASGPATDVSASRRLALARALAVKEALVAGGLDPTRIDIRPLGRTAEGLDAVDILPPGAAPPPAAAEPAR